MCNKHEVEYVTLFTANGVGVGSDDLICHYCAEGKSVEVGGDGEGVPDVVDKEDKVEIQKINSERKSSKRAIKITDGI